LSEGFIELSLFLGEFFLFVSEFTLGLLKLLVGVLDGLDVVIDVDVGLLNGAIAVSFSDLEELVIFILLSAEIFEDLVENCEDLVDRVFGFGGEMGLNEGKETVAERILIDLKI
jgi:hypothetical protein